MSLTIVNKETLYYIWLTAFCLEPSKKRSTKLL